MDYNKNKTLAGAGSALAAFSLWGFIPIYFKAVSHIPAFEVLAHRIVWTVAFLGVIITLKGSRTDVCAVFHNKKLLATLLLSSLLISTNWLVFIWAVAHDRVLEASLGYFITPLVNVALGMLFLKERLRTWQMFAVGLSVLGVGNLFWQHGAIPWVALTVSISFGLYGLVRKIAEVDAFSGLFVETALIVPPVLAYLVFIGLGGTGVFGSSDLKLTGLLMMAGLVTATPLVLFAVAAKRLKLSTIGFFQYITPIGHFLLAIFLYNEPFTDAHKITFGIIWLALTIYSFESVTAHKRK